MREQSIDRWRQRVEKAAALISQRLDNPPTLDELASAAAVSPFHLHRIWRALVGETVGETVRRLRLEVSQELLQMEGANITMTAMAVGFGTPQSFARAFRRHTGNTPSEHRAQFVARTASEQPGLAVHVEARGGTLVVALRRSGAAYADLNAAFGQVWAWAEENNVLLHLAGIYGIPLDDPVSVPESQLRYDACIDVGVAQPPAPFHVVALPSNEHARLRLVGSYEGLEAATQDLVDDWLLGSGREPADFPIYYNFINDPEDTPIAELVTEILLPLSPLKKDAQWV